MKKKVIIPIILIIGLGSMAVLGSSPGMVGNFLEAVKNNSVTKVFFSPSPTESQKTNLNSNGKVQESEVFPNERITIPSDAKNNEVDKDVPDEIVYFILFKHLTGLKAQSEKELVEGKTPVNYIELYKSQANFDEAQSQFLFQNAQDCMDAIKLIDTEAKNIITKARANFPNGELKSKDDLPAPPIELKELQQRKNDTVLNYRDTLKNFLGADKFATFNEFARQKIVPQVTTDFTKKEGK